MKKFISLLLTGLLLFAAAGCAPDQKGEITEIEVDPAYTRYDITEACGKEVTCIYIMRNLKSHAISKCHLRKCSYKTLSIQRIC